MHPETNLLSERLRNALKLLEKHQGEKTRSEPTEPLDSLMLTILSQNTNDNLRDEAYRRLRARFPSWDQVMNGSRQEVENAIRIAGLSRQKAERMQAVLRWVQTEFGELSLAKLSQIDDDNAIKLLTSQKGVGIKTAAVVLMATLGRDLCPVDTHVHRIAKRLGWVRDSLTAEKTFWVLHPNVPAGKGYSLHMNLLQFGRTICRARQPACDRCFLRDECVWEGKVT